MLKCLLFCCPTPWTLVFNNNHRFVHFGDLLCWWYTLQRVSKPPLWRLCAVVHHLGHRERENHAVQRCLTLLCLLPLVSHCFVKRVACVCLDSGVFVKWICITRQRGFFLFLFSFQYSTSLSTLQLIGYIACQSFLWAVRSAESILILRVIQISRFNKFHHDILIRLRLIALLSILFVYIYFCWSNHYLTAH